MRELASLNKYFLKYKRYFILGILFVILTNYFRILSPQLTGYVLNTVVEGLTGKVTEGQERGFNFLVKWIVQSFDGFSYNQKIPAAGAILILTAIISGIFMFLMRQTIIVMSRQIEFDQKNEIYAHYQSLDTSFYKTHSTGDLMNRISEDVSKVRLYTGPALMYVINLAAVIGFSIFFMVRTDPRLTLIALSPLPVLAFTIYYVNTIINRKSERIQQLLSDLTTHAQESYSGIRVIKSFVREKSIQGFFSGKTEEYRSGALSLAKTEAIYFPSMGLMIGLSTLITIMAAGMGVVNNEPGASVGKIAEFVMYIQMLTFPVSAIGWTASMIQRAAASQKRINEFLQEKAGITDSPASSDHITEGKIEFRNVTFTYPHTGITAMENINLKVDKGQKIAIVGRTGSGKSTLAQLLLRMYDPAEGKILLDGIQVKDLKLGALRSHISYVPQDVFLFSDTVRNNILFGKADATEDDVRDAARMAGVDKDIQGFTDGYETLIGERGVTLSGGQKQRVSIARALLKKSNILILDDCLSAVDSRTEKEITANLSVALKGKTVIIITHRIMPSFGFDRIYFLENGRIAEEGNHEELIARKGLYAGLFAGQLAEKGAERQ